MQRVGFQIIIYFRARSFNVKESPEVYHYEEERSGLSGREIEIEEDSDQSVGAK